VDLRTNGLSGLSSAELSKSAHRTQTQSHKHAHQQTTISDLIDSHRIRRIYKDRKRVHGGSSALHKAVWPAAFLHHDCEQPRHHESCLLLGSGFKQPPPPPMMVDHSASQRKHWQMIEGTSEAVGSSRIIIIIIKYKRTPLQSTSS
jgi:hypothetical protein